MRGRAVAYHRGVLHMVKGPAVRVLSGLPSQRQSISFFQQMLECCAPGAGGGRGTLPCFQGDRPPQHAN